MKLKFIIFITIFIAMSFIGLASMENKPISYDLKYNFNEGEQFAYSVVSSTKVPMKVITSMHVEMDILDIDKNDINIQTILTATTYGNTTESSYNATMNDYGKLIELNSEDLILPEMQPEIPNTIVYPEYQIRNGDTWTISVKNEGNFTTSNTLTDYELSGTKNHTIIGFKTITAKAGNFDCIGIESDLNFTLSTVTKTLNGTVYTTITRKVLGEDWVDLKGGFLVKSEYNVDKVTTADLSEMYNEIGLENVYRETPVNSHIISELINIEDG